MLICDEKLSARDSIPLMELCVRVRRTQVMSERSVESKDQVRLDDRVVDEKVRRNSPTMKACRDPVGCLPLRGSRLVRSMGSSKYAIVGTVLQSLPTL